MLKSKKHIEILKDYDKVKQNHLEKLATKKLKQDIKSQLLKTKNISKEFLKYF